MLLIKEVFLMAKKQTPKKSSKEKKSIKQHVEHHLSKKISVPIIAVVVILLLIIIRLPYTATETYTEKVEEEYEEQVPDLDNPKDVEVCDDVPSEYEILNHEFYGKPEGVSDYVCVGSFKVKNHESTEGKWTFDYVFTVNGKQFQVDEKEKKIPGFSQVTYTFESDVCKEGDDITGEYILLSSPTTIECEYVTQYDEITVTNTRTVDVQKEREVIKYESLWERLLGLNKKEKV